jgi:hypothetical protein
MKKRILTLALSLIMCLALTSVALAADDSVDVIIPNLDGFSFSYAATPYADASNLKITMTNAPISYWYTEDNFGGSGYGDTEYKNYYSYCFVMPKGSTATLNVGSISAEWSIPKYNFYDHWVPFSVGGEGGPVARETMAFDISEDKTDSQGAYGYYFYLFDSTGDSIMRVFFDYYSEKYAEAIPPITDNILTRPDDYQNWPNEHTGVTYKPYPLSDLIDGVAADAPSGWAADEVNAAIDAGLVPASIENAGWQNATTRLAAADALVLVIEESIGKTMDEIAAEKGWDLSVPYFSDTDSKAVTFLGYAGVTTGIDDNKYSPAGEYNRAQMVTMIGRAAETLLGADVQGDNPFTDDVPDWAAPYVGYAADTGITTGISATEFGSYSVLQNQQTAIFCLRTYSLFAD